MRQHDLRAPHDCRSGGACPVPLVKVNHELSTMSLSPLTPYQFVVAGESPYVRDSFSIARHEAHKRPDIQGYLFDRRQAGRILQEEWGMVPRAGELELTTCVRRFGRLKGVAHKRGEHITGARMSAHNGHEVILCRLCCFYYSWQLLTGPPLCVLVSMPIYLTDACLSIQWRCCVSIFHCR